MGKLEAMLLPRVSVMPSERVLAMVLVMVLQWASESAWVSPRAPESGSAFLPVSEWAWALASELGSGSKSVSVWEWGSE